MSIPRKLFIYLDYAAATPTDSEVKKEMLKVSNLYGNPSSFNDFGRIARKKLEESRLVVARFLTARPEEVLFTSSGSESNNLAIFGLTNLFRQPAEIITSPVEHPSVLSPI